MKNKWKKNCYKKSFCLNNFRWKLFNNSFQLSPEIDSPREKWVRRIERDFVFVSAETRSNTSVKVVIFTCNNNHFFTKQIIFFSPRCLNGIQEQRNQKWLHNTEKVFNSMTQRRYFFAMFTQPRFFDDILFLAEVQGRVWKILKLIFLLVQISLILKQLPEPNDALFAKEKNHQSFMRD